MIRRIWNAFDAWSRDYDPREFDMRPEPVDRVAWAVIRAVALAICAVLLALPFGVWPGLWVGVAVFAALMMRGAVK